MSTPHGTPTGASPRPGAWLRPDTVPVGPPAADGALAQQLRELPVAEHAAVLSAEHDRLHRLLATIDQL